MLPLGAYADSIVLDDDAVAPAPTRTTAAEAATLPLNGLTALQALELASLPAGSTLLVTGAAVASAATPSNSRCMAGFGWSPSRERMTRPWFVSSAPRSSCLGRLSLAQRCGSLCREASTVLWMRRLWELTRRTR